MADILHDLPIKAPIDRVFDAVSTPEGLDAWWTDRSSGTPGKGEAYVLWFGPEFDWRARVTRIAPPHDCDISRSFGTFKAVTAESWLLFEDETGTLRAVDYGCRVQRVYNRQ